MNKKDFNVGQKVYLKIQGGSNEARNIRNKDNQDEWILERIVTKIGKKYITVNKSLDANIWTEDRFDMTNNFRWCYTSGGCDYELYLSKQDILDDIECEKIYQSIRNSFSTYRNNREYSLEQLKKIENILGI